MSKEYQFLKYFMLSTFIIVVVIYSLNFWLSPFNRRDVSPILNDKYAVAKHYNTRLYKLNSFKLMPTNTIVLGDSRSRRLNEEMWNSPINNMSYGGGTLREAIDTFRYLDKSYAIKKVYFGLPIDLINDRFFHDNHQLKQSMILSESIDFIYYLNLSLTRASISTLITYFNDAYLTPIVLKSGKASFWKYQISDARMKARFELRASSKKSLELITEFGEYCNNKGIEIVFFIPAVHNDLQKKMAEHNANKDEDELIGMLRTMGVVIDFNFENELTLSKLNFSDPFHFTDLVAKKHVDILLNPRNTNISRVFTVKKPLNDKKH